MRAKLLLDDGIIRVRPDTYGAELFQILVMDLGHVRYEDNKWTLEKIFDKDPKRTVMCLMGSIAAAVIVQRCREDPDINFEWARIASRKRLQEKTAVRFRAVGTGHYGTKLEYPFIYNPSDTKEKL
ncbi:MAG: hypothetical protein LUH20_08710 [Lachnospiraceae bacterium]|nr:hypothetical protein [Lachnospiraceae bacterium]